MESANEVAKNERDEIWKDIPGYEGLYQVSSFGRVKSLNYLGHAGKISILSAKKSKCGYLCVTLTKDGKAKMFLIHRLVAITFLENTERLPQVNHKNEIKTDNRVSNLEWCTIKYNNNYGTHYERIAAKLKGTHHEGHPISEEGRSRISEAKHAYWNNLSAEARSKIMSQSHEKKKIPIMVYFDDGSVRDYSCAREFALELGVSASCVHYHTKLKSHSNKYGFRSEYIGKV